MKHKVPKIIYLQVCEDPDCDVPYDDHDGITWCSHRINKTDVKYVLAKDKPQRTWVGLTDEEIDQGLARTNYAMQTAGAWRDGVEWAQAQLKEKNND